MTDMASADPVTADPMRWVKVRSWHVAEHEFMSRGGQELVGTLCGRLVRGPAVDDRDGSKTCESCLRIHAGS